MKKISFFLSGIALFFVAVTPVYATVINLPGTDSDTTTASPSSPTPAVVTPASTQPSSSVVPNSGGTVSPGGACTSNSDCENENGQFYGCYPEGAGFCTLNGAAPASTAAGTSVPVAAGTPGSGNFVPLTNLPIFNTSANLTNAAGLAAFFNALYKYCIGIAATLAVLQIMRAGVMYMGGDSVTETKQARSLITTSIGGLILVLSPYVIFSIINPTILNLSLGTDLSQLQTSPTTSSTAAPASTASPAASATSLPIAPSTVQTTDGQTIPTVPTSITGTPAATPMPSSLSNLGNTLNQTP